MKTAQPSIVSSIAAVLVLAGSLAGAASAQPPARGARIAGDAEPVGNAADQCYKYIIEDKNITEDHIGEGGGFAECVYLQSVAIVAGKATFVVCCRKKDNGKCKDCEVKGDVFVLEEDRRFLVGKKFKQKCIQQP